MAVERAAREAVEAKKEAEKERAQADLQAWAKSAAADPKVSKAPVPGDDGIFTVKADVGKPMDVAVAQADDDDDDDIDMEAIRAKVRAQLKGKWSNSWQAAPILKNAPTHS
jgi:hypothetical protein